MRQIRRLARLVDPEYDSYVASRLHQFLWEISQREKVRIANIQWWRIKLVLSLVKSYPPVLAQVSQSRTLHYLNESAMSFFFFSAPFRGSLTPV